MTRAVVAGTTKGDRWPGVGSSSGGARLRLDLPVDSARANVASRRKPRHAAPCATRSGGAVGARGRKDDGPVRSGKSRSADASCAASFSRFQ